MKKFYYELISGDFNIRRSNFLKKMRIIVLLIMISVTQMFASESYAQNQQLNLNCKNESIIQILNKIENQSEYYFMFDASFVNVNQNKSINCESQPVQKVLNQLLENTKITYKISGRQIVLTSEQKTQAGQKKTISGKVTDSSGSPLPGVTIIIKGTTTGTITDNEGKYSLSNLPSNSTLVFSFVGMKEQEIFVAGKTIINIKLAEESIGIDEVVAIGYGTVKKQNLTGSISSIKSDALKERSITTLGEAFAGQLAGVRAQQSSGKPGEDLTIRIRGVSTLNASNAPLYVIDGIPSGTNMLDLNPNDIASIEVLKDASSAAIYGARGANGVILITTKTGKKGSPSFNFTASYGLQKAAKILDVMNRDEFICYNIWSKNANYLRRGGSLSDPMSSRPSSYQYPEVWESDPESLPDINWQDVIFRTAPIQNYQLSASGGGDMGSYMVSGSYMEQKGIVEGTGYRRATFRLNTTLNVGKHLKIGMNLAPSFSTSNNPDDEGRESSLHYAVNMAPIVGLQSNTEEWGYTAGAFSHVNPLEALKETHDESKNNKIYTNMWGELSITKSLSFKSQYGYNYREVHSSYFRPSNVKGGSPSAGSNSTHNWYDWSLQNTLIYSPEISSAINMNLLLGQSAEGEKIYYSNCSANGYPNDIIYTLNVASTPTTATTSEEKKSLASFFGRLNLNAKDRYLLTVNIRRDGSSKFGADTKWGWFPSAAIGWKINKESFMEENDWLDLLKLRLSIGKAGNNSIGNYESIALLGLTNYNLNNNIQSGLSTSSLGNPDLGWETKISKTVGVDFAAFNSRIQVNMDYYADKTKDMLMDVTIPYISGHGSMRQNLGEVENRGWEFELTTHNIENVFKWQTSFNISRNVNEVKKLGPDNSPIISSSCGHPTHITKIGESIGSFYMYKTDGLLLDEDYDSSGNALVPIVAGEEKGNVKIVDVNKDGKIDGSDYTIVGNNQPDFIWGLTNHFSYKSFDLNILLQGSHGSELFFIGYRHMDNGQSTGMNSFKHWIRCYKPEFSEDPFPKNSYFDKVDMSFDGKTRNKLGSNPSFNDQNVYDASFVRIKNVTLGYNFPQSICNHIGFKKARIYFMGENLFTWDNYIGANPEANNYGNNTTMPGLDYGAYPLAKRYSLGINLTF